MSDANSELELKALRVRIDKLDEKILELISDRARCAEEVARVKMAALAEGDCGAASGVRLADSACRSAAASFTGSPWPAMCMYMVAGEERSR